MRKLPKPRFNLKSPQSKSETLIFLVFRFRGKRLLYSTGLSVRPKDWDFKAQRPFERERRKDLAILYRQVENLAAYCKDIFVGSNFGDISVDQFKEELDRSVAGVEQKTEEDPEKDIPDFFTFIEQEIAEMKEKGMRKNSLKTFETHAQRLREFADEEGYFSYDDVDWNFRLKMIDWLADRNMQLAYGNKTLSMLRQFLERARRKKYHTNVQYQGTGWSIPQKKARNQTVILDLQELNALFEYPFKGQLEKVRDLFLIGAGTGQRFSDFIRYTPDHFYKTINNVPILSIISKKTDTPATVPLNLFPWLIPTLEKYNYTSPAIANQNMNDGIKEVCRIIGLDQKVLKVEQYMGRKARIEKRYIPKYKAVSSHTCRRSFATNLYRNGYSLAEIMPMTGHSTESQLRDYIGIDGEQNAENLAFRMMQQHQNSLPGMNKRLNASNL